jgi:hypothetical protein
MEIAFLMFWLICGIGAAAIASSKGRSGCGWFVIGVLIGPLALLIVGFMASVQAPPAPVTIVPATMTPSRPALGDAELGLLYNDGMIRVSRERVVYRGREYTVKSLKPVSVRQAGQGHYAIDLYNLMDRRVEEITSPNPAAVEEIAAAINRAIGYVAPSAAPAASPVSPPAPVAATPTDDRLKLLTELKQMLDASLITQAEYDTKKAEILGRM